MPHPAASTPARGTPLASPRHSHAIISAAQPHLQRGDAPLLDGRVVRAQQQLHGGAAEAGQALCRQRRATLYRGGTPAEANRRETTAARRAQSWPSGLAKEDKALLASKRQTQLAKNKHTHRWAGIPCSRWPPACAPRPAHSGKGCMVAAVAYTGAATGAGLYSTTAHSTATAASIHVSYIIR